MANAIVVRQWVNNSVYQGLSVWKQISQLVASGLNITSIPQQGYQLNQPFIPIDEHILREKLAHMPLNRAIDFHLFAEIDSTNRYLKDLAHTSTLSVCCAEKQTQGRGRFGRQWVSPMGENIYLSARLELNCCLSTLSSLSLVVALSVLDSLNRQAISKDIGVKWPNDLLWRGKKLGGILIEITAETNGSAIVIIGIGLNVNTATQTHPLPDRPWCSLYEITGHYYDRNTLIAGILHALIQHMEQFLRCGFKFFHESWQQVDYLAGQYISVSQARRSINGYARGVTDDGQLCLIDENGREHHLSSGDTSLRKLD